MSARFFVPGVHERGERVQIEGSDAHHLKDVLRLRAGDRVEIIDSAANAFGAKLSFGGANVYATLLDMREPAPEQVRVDVAQALPKGTKMDFVVEKATELGAGAIFPFWSERSIARAAGSERVARWRRVAKSAAEQCGRRDVPHVAEPASLDSLLARFRDYDAVLLAWESAEPTPLRERLPELLAKARSVLVVIGPEGGFSHGEIEAARQRGAHVISLGGRILRTETAALVVLAILNYESADERSGGNLRRIKTN